MKYLVAFIFCLTISACNITGVKPTNPQQAVYETKQSYELALTIAVAYDNLPPCLAGVKSICSEHSVKLKIKQAKDVAAPAIQAAENAVREPNFNASTQQAVIIAAQQAVIGLTLITAALQIK